MGSPFIDPSCNMLTSATTFFNGNGEAAVIEISAEEIAALWRAVSRLESRSLQVNQVYLDVSDPACPGLYRFQRTCGGFGEGLC